MIFGSANRKSAVQGPEAILIGFVQGSPLTLAANRVAKHWLRKVMHVEAKHSRGQRTILNG